MFGLPKPKPCPIEQSVAVARRANQCAADDLLAAIDDLTSAREPAQPVSLSAARQGRRQGH
jgi:hypothetical protein